jgi:hypothetical protein
MTDPGLVELLLAAIQREGRLIYERENTASGQQS